MKAAYDARWTPQSFEEAVFQVIGSQDMEVFLRTGAPEDHPFAEQVRGKRVLEYGCGAGRLTKKLATLARSYTAVDVSREMIAFAREYLSDVPGLELRVCDGVGSNIGGKYDFIFSCLVLQHIFPDDVVTIVRNLYRLLARKGTMMLDFPKFGCSIYGEFKENRYGPDTSPWVFAKPTVWSGDPVTSTHDAHGVVVYSEDDVRDVARRAGVRKFEVIELPQDDSHYYLRGGK
jgi:SAM-dependent methyltransferase